jgi:hypothetical protein
MLRVHLRGYGAIGMFETMVTSDFVSHYYRKIPRIIISFSARITTPK